MWNRPVVCHKSASFSMELSSAYGHQGIAHGHGITGLDCDRSNDPGALGTDLGFHLHGFQDEDQLPLLDMVAGADQHLEDVTGDRKSTRLNSSHVRISYAVFCLKKKKHKN